ncbi:hypothetical protein HHK36_004442 [Tetracentron sinense]|uniref:ZF-HD dimerization-type domain-containing protein n=1 Tax=Tetracentron sinense TaxID=13715 RepID=A0A834ZQ08_TETSI|nr:hypothetical protein HHK36_004442 [Tetracentron sinense]
MKEMADLSVVPYTHKPHTKTETNKEDLHEDHEQHKPVEKNRFFNAEPVVEPVKTSPKLGKIVIRYRECLRNHAASIGGHANDGCGEFMPGKEEALWCAACGCHRNFHRKELPGACVADHHLLHPAPAMVLYNSGTNPRWEKKIGGFPPVPGLSLPQPLPSPSLHRSSNGGVFGGVDLRNQQNGKDRGYDRRSETPERGDIPRNKRFRTKFTPEQKDKMLEFAERLGWRIQKHDDVALNQFCLEIGIKRHVLKVWMHNNKSVLRRKETAPAPAPVPTPPLSPPPALPQPIGV